MSNQLLPCPFCGGDAKRVTLQDEENFGGDVIICQGCDACSRVVFGEKEGLVDSWNRRAAQATNWIDPIALASVDPEYDQGFADGADEAKRLNNCWGEA